MANQHILGYLGRWLW